MYEPLKWVDHVVDEHGTVIQQGTNMSAENFNHMEEGILEAQLAIAMVLNYARQNAWAVERRQVTLTNTLVFPFNDSQETIALDEVHDSTDYIVIPEVVSAIGNVGEIVVTNKLTNGFKLAYTGSASKAVINYIVIGGYMK